MKYWSHILSKDGKDKVFSTPDRRPTIVIKRCLLLYLFLFSTSPQRLYNRFWQNMIGSKYLTSSTELVFFRPTGQQKWPSLPLISWDIIDFSRATAERNLITLNRKLVLNLHYQVCVFWNNSSTKITTLASDWQRHVLTSPVHLLNWMCGNLTKSKYSMSSSKFVFFRLIHNQNN